MNSTHNLGRSRILRDAREAHRAWFTLCAHAAAGEVSQIRVVLGSAPPGLT